MSGANSLYMSEVIEKCSKCYGNCTHRKKLFIITGYCWRCQFPVKVAVKNCEPEEYNYPCGPEGFTLSEIELARVAGVKIKVRFSKTLNESYMANICPKCNALIGKHYLFTNYYLLAMHGDLDYEIAYQGLMCFDCDDIL